MKKILKKVVDIFLSLSSCCFVETCQTVPTPEPTVQPADPTASEPVTEPAPTEVVETVDIGAAAEEEVVE